MGDIEKDNVRETFDKIPWNDYLKKMKSAKDNEIYFSPSLEIENKENKNGLSVSAVDETEWYIFYKRPRRVKMFFGFRERVDANYLTELTGQKMQDVRDCLEALLRDDLEFLEEKIK